MAGLWELQFSCSKNFSSKFLLCPTGYIVSHSERKYFSCCCENCILRVPRYNMGLVEFWKKRKVINFSGLWSKILAGFTVFKKEFHVSRGFFQLKKIEKKLRLVDFLRKLQEKNRIRLWKVPCTDREKH